MGRAIVVGVAVAVAAGVVTYAWMAGDDDRPRQVGTGAPATSPTEPAPPDGATTPTTGPSPVTSAVDGRPLVVSTLEARGGEPVRISGDGCGVAGPAAGTWRVDVWLVPAPGTVPWEPAFGQPVATTHPDEDGRWAVEVAAPRWTTEYRLEAACLDDAIPPAGFVYRHERFVVAPPDDRAVGATG